MKSAGVVTVEGKGRECQRAVSTTLPPTTTISSNSVNRQAAFAFYGHTLLSKERCLRNNGTKTNTEVLCLQRRLELRSILLITPANETQGEVRRAEFSIDGRYTVVNADDGVFWRVFGFTVCPPVLGVQNYTDNIARLPQFLLLPHSKSYLKLLIFAGTTVNPAQMDSFAPRLFLCYSGEYAQKHHPPVIFIISFVPKVLASFTSPFLVYDHIINLGRIHGQCHYTLSA